MLLQVYGKNLIAYIDLKYRLFPRSEDHNLKTKPQATSNHKSFTLVSMGNFKARLQKTQCWSTLCY